jgi:hypothetical protein
MINFLEQLVAEWYEFNGYFVRRNVMVGRRPGGGWECELDVVALHPKKKRLVHIETSMDAASWGKRESRFKKKFDAGRRHIHPLFQGLDLPERIDQIAVLRIGSPKGRATIGSGRLQMVGELLDEIRKDLSSRLIAKAAVPEQYVILRALQFAANYWK